MRIAADTTILLRATEQSKGLARELLIGIVDSEHVLLLSNEILQELARVLRYPRLKALYDLSEELVCAYIGFLRHSSEIVDLNPLVIAPIRDVNDVIVMQTAITGEADVLYTTDEEFFQQPANEYLQKRGITVLDDVGQMHRLRTRRECAEKCMYLPSVLTSSALRSKPAQPGRDRRRSRNPRSRKSALPDPC